MGNSLSNSHENIGAIKKIVRLTLEDRGMPLHKSIRVLIQSVLQKTKISLWLKYKLAVTFSIFGNYLSKYKGFSEDSFSIYWHKGRYAKYYFQAPKSKRLKIISTPVSLLIMPSGELFSDHITTVAGEKLFEDKDVAIYGGVSRLALKLFALQQGLLSKNNAKELIQKELPVNDIDIIFNQKIFTGELRFNQKSWWAIIVNDIETEIQSIIETRDCTFNQCIIYNGRLYYTEHALEATCSGEITFVVREGEIIGGTATVLEDGKKYINKEGLYRALGYLLRGKAKKLLIYKENLELEAPKIGKLWVRLLIKKIISVDDIHKRCLAIDNWFNCAKKLGVTTTLNPKDFLEELLFKFPEAKQNILDQKSLLFYNFEIWPRFFAKRVIDNIVVEMFMRLGDNGMIQGMSNEMVTIDQNFFRGKHHNTEELLDFIDSFKNE